MEKLGDSTSKVSRRSDRRRAAGCDSAWSSRRCCRCRSGPPIRCSTRPARRTRRRHWRWSKSERRCAGEERATAPRRCTGPRMPTTLELVKRAAQGRRRRAMRATTTARRRCRKPPSAATPPVIAALLKAGADVESPNPEGQTALMTVARTGHVDAAKLLIRAGANVNAVEQWRGQTALMWAAAQSQPEMVRLLIKSGAKVDARSDVRDWARARDRRAAAAEPAAGRLHGAAAGRARGLRRLRARAR